MSEHHAEHGYFRTRDGVRLFYSMEGPREAPPLIFCYGLVCSKLQWKYQWEHFRRTHRVIYVDYRGHNQSDRPADPSSVTIENCARDIVDLLDELAIPRACILGHSLGVNIILDVYRLAPGRVSSLVLANGTPKDPFETMFHHNFLQIVVPWIQKAHALFPELVQKFWESQGTNPVNQEFVALAGFNTKYAKREDIREYLRLTATVDVAIFLSLLEDFMAYDATPWLQEVKAPTLIIAGENDLITPPKNQRIFAELIPYSELCVVSEGSHCSQMEKPEFVNTVIRNFLESVASGRAPRRPAKRKARSRAGGRLLRAAPANA